MADQNAKLKKLNADMAKFLGELTAYSDKIWGGNRSPTAERHYKRAIKLVERAKALRTTP